MSNTQEIREKAEALIKVWKAGSSTKRVDLAMKELEASLPKLTINTGKVNNDSHKSHTRGLRLSYETKRIR